jgi:hypothetical protein
LASGFLCFWIIPGFHQFEDDFTDFFIGTVVHGSPPDLRSEDRGLAPMPENNKPPLVISFALYLTSSLNPLTRGNLLSYFHA